MRKAKEYYKAREITGAYELDVHRLATYEQVEEYIDNANRAAVAEGYKADQYQITQVEVYTYYDDTGRFESEERYEGVIEVYPEEV